MIIVNTEEDFRMLYSILHTCDLEESLTIKIKRALRKYINNLATDTRRIIKDYGDSSGYISLEEFPAHIKSMDVARKYFHNNMRIAYRYSQYDCTGQAFTVWDKIFVRNEKYMVYHRVAFDV